MLRKPVCCKCNVAYRVLENGVYVAEMYENNTKVYKLWCGDQWKCPICSHTIVAGFGKPTHNCDRDLEAEVIRLKNRGATVFHDKEVRNGKITTDHD